MIHGLLITGTNVNTMVVPGFVAQVHTEFKRTGDLLMPCHEYCGLGTQRDVGDSAGALRTISSSRAPTGGFPVRNVERLCLAHFWVAFGAFLFACLIGTWQMWVRSPLGAKIGTPGQYFISVTAHGVSMAYVLTTFFIMGFGYFVAVTALNRPLPGKLWAWAAYLDRAPRSRRHDHSHSSWPGIGTLHLLPPADRERVVLHRLGADRRGIVDLVHPDARGNERMETGESGSARSAGDVSTVANAVLWLWTTVGVAVRS